MTTDRSEDALAFQRLESPFDSHARLPSRVPARERVSSRDKRETSSFRFVSVRFAATRRRRDDARAAVWRHSRARVDFFIHKMSTTIHSTAMRANARCVMRGRRSTTTMTTSAMRARRAAGAVVVVRASSSSNGGEGESTEEPTGEDVTRRKDFDVSADLEADIARYAAAKEREVSSSMAASTGAGAEEGASAMDGIKEAIDTFLLYDFFVILFILAWLILGVGVRLSKGNGLSYDEPFLGTWLFLWPWLFQPLLGVHMLATLVSPAIGWAKKKQLLGDDVWQ